MTKEIDKNSMCYWFPLIKDLHIPIPKTRIVRVPQELIPKIRSYNEGEIKSGLFSMLDSIKEAIKEVGGYPIFIRTDQASAKHSWEQSCFVSSEDALLKNLFRVVEFHICADMLGLDFDSFVVREYIPMKNLFTAFNGNMPVNPEIRFFVNNGEVLCWHWYWVEDAIWNPSIENWMDVLNREKENTSGNEILWLGKDARKVAEALKNEGFWSVDFCKAKDGRWVLIDLALGTHSYHVPNCPIYKKYPHIDRKFKRKG